MSKFARTFLVDLLNEAVLEGSPWLRDMLAYWEPAGNIHSGEVPQAKAAPSSSVAIQDQGRGLRLAVRDGYLNMYRAGQSIARIEFGRDGLQARVHNKYVYGAQGTGQTYVTIRRAEQQSAVRGSILHWGKSNFASYPWREERSRWHALMVEVLLQRTRASTVARVYTDFKSSFPTVTSLGAAEVAEVGGVLNSLGLHWRWPFLIRLAQVLSTRSEVPEDPEELRLLPGVGPYAAAAFASLHAGRRAVILDANIVRWLSRLTGQEYDGETRRKKWVMNLMEQLTPRTNVREFNYALLDFTMIVCRVRPRCDDCPVTRYCEYFRTRTNVPDAHSRAARA